MKLEHQDKMLRHMKPADRLLLKEIEEIINTLKEITEPERVNDEQEETNKS
jgi:hypothetical protein